MSTGLVQFAFLRRVLHHVGATGRKVAVDLCLYVNSTATVCVYHNDREL